jgi:chromosome segregation ATPase
MTELETQLEAAQAHAVKALEELNVERERVSGCEREIAVLDVQLGGLDPTTADFDALAQVLVQRRDVQRAKLSGLQERAREAASTLANARQAMDAVRQAIEQEKLAHLNARANELDQALAAAFWSFEAWLRETFTELRANRTACNRSGGNWERGSAWVGAAPPDHSSLFQKALERWIALGKPGQASTKDREAA